MIRTHSRPASLLVLTLALVASGCGKKADGSKDKPEPAAAEVDFSKAEEGDTGLQIAPFFALSGNAGVRVKGFGDPGLDVSETRLKLKISGPKGTEAKIQATSFVTRGDDEPVVVELDLMHAYALAGATSDEISIDVFARPKGKKPVKQALVLAVGKSWAGLAAMQKDGLPTDAASKRRNDAMLYFRTDIAGLIQLVGTKKARVLDVDFIATEQRKPTVTGTCGTYVSKAGKTMTLTKRTFAVTVSVTDRRKHEVIETKTFDSASPSCPSTTTSAYESSSQYVDGAVDDAAILEWLGTKVKAAKTSEEIEVPEPTSKLIDTGKLDDEALSGPVTIETFEARLKKLGWKTKSVRQPTEVSQEEISASLENGAGGCADGASVEVRSYAAKYFNKHLPTATSLDDQRGIRLTAAKKEVITLLEPKLAKVTEKLDSVKTLATSSGMTVALPEKPSESADELLNLEKTGGDGATVYHYSYAGLDGKNGYATKRVGDSVITVRCHVPYGEPDTAPSKAAAAMLRKLTK